ncbi:MAG: transporter, partial [Burkholderiaceae bacterium]|nr:transporter [Burkholderiaceae bacterium]
GFYNLIQRALGHPGAVGLDEYFGHLVTFGHVAGTFVVIAVALDWFIKHYIFRWRTAMNDFYMSHWDQLRKIEGASQRVQEDTMRFARNAI